MVTTMEEVIAKTDMVEIEPKTGLVLEAQPPKEEGVNDTEPKTINGELEKENGTTNGKLEKENGTTNGKLEKKNGTTNCEVEGENRAKDSEELKNEKAVQEENGTDNKEPNGEVVLKDKANKEEVAVQIESNTGVSFPVKLDDGKQLNSLGLRKKKMLGIGIKIYGFGIYADNEKLKDLLKSKIGKTPAKPTKEMYQVVIDSDVGMMVRLVIVFSSLTMNMVKRNFDEGLGASIKKLNGGRKDDALANKVMDTASDNIKLTSGSVIEITRLPGYILQTKVMTEVVSKVESELLCRAFIHLYLGDDPFDKDAKEKFGTSLLSLF